MVSLYSSVHVFPVAITDPVVLVHTFTGWFIFRCLHIVRDWIFSPSPHRVLSSLWFLLPCRLFCHTILPSDGLNYYPKAYLPFLLCNFSSRSSSLRRPSLIWSLFLSGLWRHVGSSLSLRGRCHWNIDAVWVGVGGRCVAHVPAWRVSVAAKLCVCRA